MSIQQFFALGVGSQFLTLGVLAIHFVWSERKNSLRLESEGA